MNVLIVVCANWFTVTVYCVLVGLINLRSNVGLWEIWGCPNWLGLRLGSLCHFVDFSVHLCQPDEQLSFRAYECGWVYKYQILHIPKRQNKKIPNKNVSFIAVRNQNDCVTKTFEIDFSYAVQSEWVCVSAFVSVSVCGVYFYAPTKRMAQQTEEKQHHIVSCGEFAYFFFEHKQNPTIKTKTKQNLKTVLKTSE